MMWKIILFSISFLVCISGQTESGYWGKTDTPYDSPDESRKRDYTFNSTNFSGTLTEAFTMSYWFLISDQDGDNCPFRPSCSEFFLQAVKTTDPLTGTLMFFDRFTRDLNFISRHNHYEKTPDGYFSDPPEKYIF